MLSIASINIQTYICVDIFIFHNFTEDLRNCLPAIAVPVNFVDDRVFTVYAILMKIRIHNEMILVNLDSNFIYVCLQLHQN